ncbi:MAG: hypothetical protein F7C08_01485 [Desulfurococcales archaeon]|nr:hypothetical protein [Desulfurococcales archaeon]
MGMHGLSFFAEGNGKTPYIAGGIRELSNTIYNAMDDLHQLPVRIDKAIINNFVRDKVTGDFVWILVDDEDVSIIGALQDQLEASRSYEHYVEENLGPKLYMARLIYPIDVSHLDDVRVLKESYDGIEDKKLRHVVLEAINIDILTEKVSQIKDKCSGSSNTT